MVVFNLVLLSWGCILYINGLIGHELYIMVKNYRKKVSMGSYNNSPKRGMGGGRSMDLLRLALQAGRVLGGSIVFTAISIEVGDT